MCGACGSGADSAGECVLKEQPGQLWTSATAALRAVNAAWLEKENKLPGLSFVLEVCCPNAIAPEGTERRQSQLRQTRAPLPPPIIRYTLLFPLARSSDNAGKEKEWQREAEHSCTMQNFSIFICQTKPVFKKTTKMQ